MDCLQGATRAALPHPSVWHEPSLLWLLPFAQQVQAVDPDRPRFHVHPPQGWMNDPNGGRRRGGAGAMQWAAAGCALHTGTACAW